MILAYAKTKSSALIDNTETSTGGITGESIGEITSEIEVSPPEDDELPF